MRDFWIYQAGLTFFLGIMLMTFAIPTDIPVSVEGRVVADTQESGEGVTMAMWGFGFALASFVELVTFGAAHYAKKRYQV